MWINAENSERGPLCLNSRYVRTFRVMHAPKARTYPNGSGTVTHPLAPASGHVVIAYLSSGPAWLCEGHDEPAALALYGAILDALGSGARRFDCGSFLAQLEGIQ